MCNSLSLLFSSANSWPSVLYLCLWQSDHRGKSSTPYRSLLCPLSVLRRPAVDCCIFSSISPFPPFPPFLSSFLPSFLPPFLPPFLPSSLPPFLPSSLPSPLPFFPPSLPFLYHCLSTSLTVCVSVFLPRVVSQAPFTVTLFLNLRWKWSTCWIVGRTSFLSTQTPRKNWHFGYPVLTFV